MKKLLLFCVFLSALLPSLHAAAADQHTLEATSGSCFSESYSDQSSLPPKTVPRSDWQQRPPKPKKIVLCPFLECEQEFYLLDSEEHDFTSHFFNHFKKEPFVCTFPGCTKTSNTIRGLRSHRWRHGNETQLKKDAPSDWLRCPLCHEKAPLFNEKNLYEHIFKTHSQAKHPSTIVPLLEDKEEITSYALSSHPPLPLIESPHAFTPILDQKIPSKQPSKKASKRANSSLSSEKLLSCPFPACTEKFGCREINNWMNHAVVYHFRIPLRCPRCPQSHYSSIDDLYKHLEIHSEIPKKKLTAS